MFHELSSVLANWLCIGCLSEWAGVRREYSNMQEIFSTTLYLVFFQDNDLDGQLVLRCVADARPPNVTYYWYHNEEPLTAVTGDTLQFR